MTDVRRAPNPQPITEPGPDAPWVAFDFDGTLTRHDTLAPYLVRLRGLRVVAEAAARNAVPLALVVAGRGRRDETKTAFLRQTLRGVTLARASAVAEEFADETIVRRMRRDTVARMRWHIESGHRVVVVSASPMLVVEPIARRLGVHATIASHLEVNDRGLLTGELVGENCRAEEKARRVRAHFDADHRFLYAYGNSAADEALLALADRPVRVDRVRISASP